MAVYYNENDPFAAAWLRELIKAGQIAFGIVDERSIEDVQPDDLTGFTQCHFFAGIGGWSYALRLADWPDDCPVWTGSCPCQPFSIAGKGKGLMDGRHLWPEFYRLILQHRPVTVFGEQVASKGGLAWFDLVYTDLENTGYTVGAVDLCASGFGAPHIRQRIYWVAHADGTGLERRGGMRECSDQCSAGQGSLEGEFAITGPVDSCWRNADWLFCRDEVWRPVEPGTFPLAYGVSARVGRLRGYGNAIVPPQAAQFIKAFRSAGL